MVMVLPPKILVGCKEPSIQVPLDPRSIIVMLVVACVALYNTSVLSLSTCASPLVFVSCFAKKPHTGKQVALYHHVIKICICFYVLLETNLHLSAKIEKCCMKTCLYSGTWLLFVSFSSFVVRVHQTLSIGDMFVYQSSSDHSWSSIKDQLADV